MLWTLTVTSPDYGAEDYGPYDTKTEALAAVKRIKTKAAQLDDGASRHYSIEAEMPAKSTEVRRLAEKVTGYGVDTIRAKRILDRADWYQYYPTCIPNSRCRSGYEYDGGFADEDDEGYVIVGNEAMTLR